MKYLYQATLLLILLLPCAAHAHGGVSNQIGNAIVFLNQTPLSPLVGEQVQMAFSLKDTAFQAVAKKEVTLTLTDTYYGDESKDKIILTKVLHTDENGSFEFSYTFTKENFFDVDISFSDPKTGEAESTGFLVQPRAVKNGVGKYLLLGILAGGTVAILLSRPKKYKAPQLSTKE